MPGDSAYVPPRELRHRLARKWTAMRAVSPLRHRVPEFVLSVCFDDAPLSAATRGADILARHDVAATFYIATGLLGTNGISGPVCTHGDLRRLHALGQEIALHGHAHGDMSRMSPDLALADIRRNRDMLAQLLGTAPGRHFAYPYGATTIALKKRLVEEVATARGVLGGLNGMGRDAMHLAAHDLRSDPQTVARAMGAMATAACRGGWVIVFTHDVAPDPSPYGIAPATLDEILRQARMLGARVLPVGPAWARLFGNPAGKPGMNPARRAPDTLDF